MTESANTIDTQVRHLLVTLPQCADVDDDVLRDRLVQLERVVNSVQAAQADVMVELSRRAARLDFAEEQRSGISLSARRTEFVADEISATLSCTKVEASKRYGLALSVVEHPEVAAAWKHGDVTGRKAQVICDGLLDVASPAAEALAQQAAVYAIEHTAPEVRRWLSKRVIEADPGMAEVRRRRAVADRHITFTPLPDGVAELSALLPGVQARQIYDTVNAMASAAGPGDVRSMDQRRADALVDLVTGRADPPQVAVHLVVTADTLLGESAEPAEVVGLGPVTSSKALELLGVPGTGLSAGSDGWPNVDDIVFRRLLTDPDSGHLVSLSERQYRPSAALDRSVRARDRVCRFPGCNRPATKKQGTDLDHTIPWPRGQTTAANLAVLCRHHHRLKHSPGWSVDMHPSGVMVWTSPAGRTFRSEPWVYVEPGERAGDIGPAEPFGDGDIGYGDA